MLLALPPVPTVSARPTAGVDERTVHDVAAHLFWTMARHTGVEDAFEAVTLTSGECLFHHPDATAVLMQFGVDGRYRDAVAAEAHRFCRAGKQLQGVIYSSDASSGRSPSAQGLPTDDLRDRQAPVIRCANVPTCGKLVLRSPLPAVVFCDGGPDDGLIRVQNTHDALGFDYPLFFQIRESIRNSHGRGFLTGLFAVPLRRGGPLAAWRQAIPNANPFTASLRGQVDGGTQHFEVDVTW